MFTRTEPSLASYQVGTACGCPSGLTVVMTAPFGRARKASNSLGKGPSGTPATYPSRAENGPAHAATLARGRGARAVERGGFENRRAWERLRGFESHPRR